MLTKSNRAEARPASTVVVGKARSETDAVVTVAAPDHHGDREGEDGRQGGPAKGDQHRARFKVQRMLPTLVTGSCRRFMVVTPSRNPAQAGQRLQERYPSVNVIVLDDDVNTFQHVVDVLVRHLPGMQPDRAWELAHRIDGEGSAVVWSGPLEQGELYHQLLAAEGLTMAPLGRG